MSLGTRVDSNQGPVVSNNSAGFQVALDTNNRGYGPYSVDTVPAYTLAAVTLSAGNAGVSTLSGSAGVITVVMPLASTCPGAEFILRSLSLDAHVLTASQETAGTKAFVTQLGAAARGSKITFGALVGNSTIIKSDGVNFHLISFSGSASIS